MKVALVFPPVWDCDSPYPSLALLSAFLKRNGRQIIIRDLNIELQSLMLSGKYITKTVDEIREKSKKGNIESAKRQLLYTAMNYYDAVGEGAFTKAVEEIKNHTDDISKIIWAKSVIESGRFIISAPFAPARFTVESYYAPQPINNIKALLVESENNGNNIFYEVLENEVVPSLKGCNVLGISIVGAAQLIPAFTLAKLARKKLPDVKIIIGGAFLPFMKTAILNSPVIFDFIDAAVIGEGETPLSRLCDFIEGKDKIEEIPNLIYRDLSNNVKETGKYYAEDVNELPTPDYQEFPWEKYFLSKRILTYISARGCPWNKCCFCSLTTNYGQRFRARDVSLVVEDLKTMKARYNTSYFMFDDESIPAKRIEDFATAFLENKLDIKWICLSRFDKSHNYEIFDKAYQAGLRMVTYGLESGSQAVLDLMKKGIHIEDVPRILKDSKNAGIWNNAFIIFGFPGEQKIDRLNTTQFILSNSNLIDSLTYGEFRIEGGSEVYRMPEAHGVQLEAFDPTYFGPIYPFKYENGTTLSDIFKHMGEFQKLTSQEIFNQFNFYGYDPRRMFIYLVKNGKSRLRNEIFTSIIKRILITNILKWGVNARILLKSDERLIIKAINDTSSKYLIYNPKNGNSFEINLSALEIIKLAKNGIDYDSLLIKYAEKFKLTFNIAAKDVLMTLAKFINDGYITLDFPAKGIFK
ncbi:MAG: B12-binding domain-containing radical SAM protein [Firmicutes bacterium]|nr:B12-binding domain-containing radical SAM protein [Bacillota bacterium]